MPASYIQQLFFIWSAWEFLCASGYLTFPQTATGSLQLRPLCSQHNWYQQRSSSSSQVRPLMPLESRLFSSSSTGEPASSSASDIKDRQLIDKQTSTAVTSTSSNPQPRKSSRNFLQLLATVLVLQMRLVTFPIYRFFRLFKEVFSSKENFDNFMKYQQAMSKKSPSAWLIVQLYNFTRLLQRPRIYFQVLLAVFVASGLKKYAKYSKSLVQEVSYANFLKLLAMAPERMGAIRTSSSALVYTLDGKRTVTRMVNLEGSLLQRIVASGVDFYAMPPPTNVLGLVWSAVYLGVIWTIYSRTMQGPRDESVGKSRKEMDMAAFSALSFDDIAGQDKARQEVSEVCDMLKNPGSYARLGARVPSGVLLTGPPGTGKTLLARITAMTANVPFISCSATEFVEVFVGRGPARIRKLFKEAAKSAPSIIFIDEIDSIGRSRRSNTMNSEQESSLNQLLTCMDGLDTTNNGVIVMAATNRPELLDPALLRPGRFDRIVNCPPPDRDGRLAILKVHAKRLQLEPGVNLEVVATATPGLCGADLAQIMNEAAIRAVRRRAELISQTDVFGAVQSYFEARGLPLSGLTSAWSLPNWLKGGDKGSSEVLA